MNKEAAGPSESEWKLMEILWDSQTPLTSAEVVRRLQDVDDMTPKMVRVLMNRLCQKGIVTYQVDERDSRIYHYTPQKTKEECLNEKSRKFVDSYFSGNQTSAMAALLHSFSLSEEQIVELETILEQSKRR